MIKAQIHGIPHISQGPWATGSDSKNNKMQDTNRLKIRNNSSDKYLKQPHFGSLGELDAVLFWGSIIWQFSYVHGRRHWGDGDGGRVPPASEFLGMSPQK